MPESTKAHPGPYNLRERVATLEEFSTRDAERIAELSGRLSAVEQQHAAEEADATVGVVLRGLLVTALSAGVWSLMDHLITQRMERPRPTRASPPSGAPASPALIPSEFPNP